MGRTLKRNNTGDDVRQLQVDLRRMLPAGHVQVTRHGHFGPDTEKAVRLLQHKLNLHKDPPGVAGPEVQCALDYRVCVISGSIGRKFHLLDSELKLPTGLGAAHPDGRNLHLLDGELKLSPDLPKPSPDPGGAPPYKPAPVKHYTGGWLAQLQGAGMITPAPLYPHDPKAGDVHSGGFSFGLIYRTAKDGPSVEVNFPGPGFFVNTKTTSSDPSGPSHLKSGIEVL